VLISHEKKEEKKKKKKRGGKKITIKRIKMCSSDAAMLSQKEQMASMSALASG
jgi:hypothetical protein